MGIYDREYYRKEGPSYLGSILSTGAMCKWLVGINIALYVLQLITFKTDAGEGGVEGYGIVTSYLAMQPKLAFYHFEIWRFITGIFLHSPLDPWHLIFNMLMLWFFGRHVEDLYGSKEFLAFYLLAGVVGNVFWGLTTLWQYPGMEGPVPFALGASGAVMGVMVLCASHYPFRTIYLMWVVPVPLWLATVLWVGVDLFYFMRGSLGVAVAAHLGGAAFGFIYYKLNWRILSALSDLTAKIRREPRPRLRVYTEDAPTPVAALAQPNAIDEQLEAKTDAILEKLKREGIGSLSSEERDVLLRASEQYRKKRS